MSEHGLHPQRAIPRDRLAPFFVTAPLALVVAGGVLLDSGVLALSNHWSSLTLSLAHLGTLGLISMLLVGILYALLAVAGDGETPPLSIAHGLYYSLLAAVLGLCWGTARANVAAVFFAVGAMGVMGVLLLVHAGRLVGRAGDRGPTLAALRLALWGYFLVGSLGIWLAHGHGGMLFPGPRALWLQVHLSVGLCGWVGAMLMAASWRVVPALHGGRPVAARVAVAMHACVAFGITLPCVLLLADYFGLLGAGDWDRAPWAAALGLPALAAVWLAHPIVALHSLRGCPEDGGLLLWRTGLGLGPFTAIAAVAAFTLDDPRFGLLFGWLAIFGWAGLSLHALLLRVVPFLTAPTRGSAMGGGTLWTEQRLSEAGVRVTFALHLLALVVGGIGIVTRRDLLVRIAGAAMVGLGVGLLVLHVRSMRGSASSSGRDEQTSSRGLGEPACPTRD